MRTGSVRNCEKMSAWRTRPSGCCAPVAAPEPTDWPGAELAERLGVTPRTVRRDIDRLRSLGYPVDAAPGVAGGYQLGPGGHLPAAPARRRRGHRGRRCPRCVDRRRRVRYRAAGAGRARQARPPAARPAAAPGRRLRASTVMLAPPSDRVDAELLVTLAQACDANERVVLTYLDREGAAHGAPYRALSARVHRAPLVPRRPRRRPRRTGGPSVSTGSRGRCARATGSSRSSFPIPPAW